MKLIRSLSTAPLAKWAILFILILEIWAVLYQKRFALGDGIPHPFVTDALGYYDYLPALFIYEDLGWDWTADYPQYGFPEEGYFSSYISETTGKAVNKYSVGVAIMLLPFFFLGNLAAFVLDFPPDGFSVPYRFMGYLGGLFYGSLGLWYIRKLLLLYFNEWLTALTILGIGLGTNLLYYTIQEPIMSHVYSFCSMAMLTYFCIQWFSSGEFKDIFWLAISAGLCIVLRPTNGLILLLPLLYGIFSHEPLGGIQGKVAFIRDHWGQLLLGLLIGLLVISPQLLYWKVYGGDWLFYGYGDEGFLFTEPKPIEVLFGFRKGWFAYSPILLGIIPGFFLLKRYVPGVRIPLLIFSLLNVYIVSSWWCWWYGGSLGMRALIEMSAPLSLTLASFFAWMAEVPWRKTLLLVMLGFFLVLNGIMTYQYKWTYIHWEDMNARAYWKVFMRPRLSAEEFEEVKKLQGPSADYSRRERSSH